MKFQVGDRVYVKGWPFRGHTGVIKDARRLKITFGLVKLYYVKTDETVLGHGLIKVSASGLRKLTEDDHRSSPTGVCTS
jgi:hypothetical protein